MSFASDSGYTPLTIDDLMDSFRTNINTQFGLNHTTETFVGTNFYKYFYALAQLVQSNEIRTSEIFLKLIDYIDITNEAISRPVVTGPGIIEKLESEGYTASVKPPADADAGKLYICVDVDETALTYATTKLAINTIIKDSSVAGVVTQGTETSAIVLTNGQSFTFKYDLPIRLTPLLRLTITLSTNNQVVIDSVDDIKQQLIDNIEARYRLGKNFEPQRYYTVDDAPWAQTVLLEYSLDSGSTWSSGVYVATYRHLFVIDLANISVVEV